ncbi:uncharacterized protein LTR77_001223 [Saxophila tyrrhenica]|uniref:Phytanoyl-CoA dioxygenase family protein n=1 Tax=Saxophila tyrrhenica TaxID=1690608 RepID=A0AAV9PM82_9PEZI|nr:hypothetical protein LTR77_001223 [Saxophila tyrrhenica]
MTGQRTAPRSATPPVTTRRVAKAISKIEEGSKFSGGPIQFKGFRAKNEVSTATSSSKLPETMTTAKTATYGANGNVDPSNYAWARKHLSDEGYVVIPDILTPSEADHILARLWKAKESGEKRGDLTHMQHLDPNDSNIRVFYLLELDAVFRELIAHPVAVDLVKSVLGEDFLISNFTANIATPGSKSMALHSDQSIVVPDPWREVWAINCMFCLPDIYAENGATKYIPGSNKWTSRAEVPDNAPELLVPFEAKKGSMICMDARVWHTSGANVTQNVDRPLLFGYYTKPFLRQQVNWTAKLPQSIKDEVSDDMFKWLGLGAVANTGRTGDLRFLHVQYPDGEKAGRPESDGKEGPLLGGHDDRQEASV